jgi:membrane fusion protein, multidrug efflux system
VRFPESAGARIGIAVVVLLIGVIVLRVMQARTAEEAAPTVEQIRDERGVPVTAATAMRGDMDVWQSFSGTVSGVRDAVVRARTGDEIAAVPVAVGQRVSRGQPLVRVAGEAAQARVRQAEAAQEQARRAVDRLRPLHDAGAISDQEWENAVTRFEMARDDLAAARDVLTLTSPLAGTVMEVTARPGMIPSPGDPLVRVADVSQLVVRLQVSAPDARAIREGEPARVPGGPTGEVSRIALQADPETRLVEVEVAFPPGSRLVPGTLERVEVRVGARPDAVQVPRDAVREGQVWVIDDDGRALRRSVRVGLLTTERAEIESGVEAGERVVVRGASLLSDGVRVRVVNGDDGVG